MKTFDICLHCNLLFFWGKHRLEAETTGYEAERDSVQNTLDVTNSLVVEKEKEIQQQSVEVSF